MSKTIILTGGSSGIGLAMAKRFVSNGYHVCNLDIHASDVGEYHFCDMRNFDQVQQVVSDICVKHTVYGLVSNAATFICLQALKIPTRPHLTIYLRLM